MQRDVRLSASPDSAAVILATWRTTLLDRILVSTFGIGFFVITAVIAILLQEQPARAQQLLPVFALSYTLLGVITFMRQIPYQIRAGVLSAIFYGLSVMSLLQSGLSGEGRILLLGWAVISGLLFGRNAGFGATFVSGATLGSIGTAVVLGSITLPNSTITTAAPWLTATLLQILFTLLLVLSAGYLLAQLSNSLQASVGQTQQLQANAQLQQQQAEQLTAQAERLAATERMLRDLVATLETPVIQLRRDVLLSPLVGTIDAQRAEALTQRLLQAASTIRNPALILDVSGVTDLDSTTIAALTKTIQALRLIGCKVTLSGVAPAMALLLAQAQINLHGIPIVRSPEQALAVGS
jgi:anti-anti-sigma factor